MIFKTYRQQKEFRDIVSSLLILERDIYGSDLQVETELTPSISNLMLILKTSEVKG